MRIALLSDAHGNAVGTRACLDAIACFDPGSIYFLGDAVGYLSGGPEVVDLLRDRGVVCQCGNHEAMLLGRLPLDGDRDRLYRLAPTRSELGAERLEWIGSWPDVRQVEEDGVRMLLVHGSPSPSLTEYVRDDAAIRLPAHFPYDAAFLGHTHYPFIRKVGSVCVVNVGSCGLPRDRGDLASFTLYDTRSRQARVIRVPFDPTAALEQFGVSAAAEVAAVFERRGPAFGELMACA